MARRMDFLTAREKTLITEDFGDLTNDTQTGISVTYKSFTSKAAFNPQSGSIVSTYASSTIQAFRSPLTDKEVFESGGRYQLGDIRYLVAVSDISNPKKDDEITDSGKLRLVYEHSTDPLSIFHSIIARNLKGR